LVAVEAQGHVSVILGDSNVELPRSSRS